MEDFTSKIYILFLKTFYLPVLNMLSEIVSLVLW